MIATLSKLMGARSQSLEREMKTMMLYLEKEMNVGQNVIDSAETTMDKVTTALGGFATSVGTLAETLKDMAANQRTAWNVGDDQQKKMVSELGQCREMLAHVDSFSLIADLLFGNGVDCYVGAMQGPDFPQEVAVRSFSAGSFSGLTFLHILWPISRVTTKGCLGAIACPPWSLLDMSRAKAEDQLHLIHYEGDGLCSWKPGLSQLQESCTSYTYVTRLLSQPCFNPYSKAKLTVLSAGCLVLAKLYRLQQ